MSFTGIPLVLDQWLDVGGGKICNLTAAKVFSSQPIAGQGQGDPMPPIDSLYGWYKADGYSYADGADVTLPVLDFSGQSNHLNASNSLPLNELVFHTNIINGLPVLRVEVSAEDTNRDIPDFGASGYTGAIVIRKRTHNASLPTIDVMGAQGFGVTLALRYVSTASQVSYTFRGLGASITTPIVVPLDSWQIITFSMSAAEGIPRLKTNNTETSGPVTAGAVTITAIAIQISSVCDVAEALNYSKKLSDSELHDLRAYLSVKYGIAII